MSESDWIKLLVKFKGQCKICGNIIVEGEYALWSKSTKKIKHLECKIDTHPKIEKKEIDKYRYISKECYLCKKVENLQLGSMSEYLVNGDEEKSPFLCKSCLENPRSYLKYQMKMLEKIKNIVKLKS